MARAAAHIAHNAGALAAAAPWHADPLHRRVGHDCVPSYARFDYARDAPATATASSAGTARTAAARSGRMRAALQAGAQVRAISLRVGAASLALQLPPSTRREVLLRGGLAATAGAALPAAGGARKGNGATRHNFCPSLGRFLFYY